MLNKEQLLLERNVRLDIEGNWKDKLKSKIVYDQPYSPYNHLKDLNDIEPASKLFYHYLQDTDSKIILVTDYDCDGVSSALVLTKFLQGLFIDTSRYITIVNQRKWGNGLNDNLMKEILDIRYNKWVSDKILLITADMCSSDNLPIGTLRSKDIDVILTDHHKIPVDNYPNNANYVINVMREDNKFPYYISGAYTAYLLCVATLEHFTSIVNKETILTDIASYAGISTIVDQMPLNISYNRENAIVGIRAMNTLKDKSIGILNKLLKLPRLLLNKSISWSIGPFFNSGNRCNTERVLFDGMLTTDESKIRYAYQENNRRKLNQRDLNKQVLEDIARIYPDMANTFGIAVEIVTEYGVAGPVASRVGETFHRPTIVFRRGIDQDILSGSGRAIIDIDLLAILKSIQTDHPEVVYKAAGHAGACGIEIYANQLDKFRILLSDRIKEVVNGKLPLPYLDVIGYIEPEDISLKLALEVEHFGPYGNSWSEPCFITKAKFLSSYNYGTSKLCKFSRYGRTTFQGVYSFDRTNGITLDNWQDAVIQDKYYYIVFTIQLGYVNNNYTLDIAIKDIIPVE